MLIILYFYYTTFRHILMTYGHSFKLYIKVQYKYIMKMLYRGGNIYK